MTNLQPFKLDTLYLPLRALNLDSPTKCPPNGNSSLPDVSLNSSHLALSVAWSTCNALNSDHLPIGISFDDDQPLPQTACSFVNLKKAKWGLYISEAESMFASESPPTSMSTGEKVFQRILLTASKHNIPAGYRKDFRSGMSREAIDLANEHDRLHVSDPQDPKIQRLNKSISEIVSHESKSAWIKQVEDSHPKDNPEKHWKLLWALSGKRPHQSPNQPIIFKNKSYSKRKAIANRFCKQFMSVTVHKSSKRSCHVDCNLKKKPCLDTAIRPFTDKLTKDAIQKSKNFAAFGLDELTALHFKFLGPLAITYLTTLFKLSMAHANLPAIWKRANIVPIPKPGKPANMS
jgi:hypothetical protein